MSAAARPDLDQLAHALARLLSTWWQLRTTATMQSRAPPLTQPDHPEPQFHFSAEEPLNAGKR